MQNKKMNKIKEYLKSTSFSGKFIFSLFGVLAVGSFLRILFQDQIWSLPWSIKKYFDVGVLGRDDILLFYFGLAFFTFFAIFVLNFFYLKGKIWARMSIIILHFISIIEIVMLFLLQMRFVLKRFFIDDSIYLVLRRVQFSDIFQLSIIGFISLALCGVLGFLIVRLFKEDSTNIQINKSELILGSVTGLVWIIGMITSIILSLTFFYDRDTSWVPPGFLRFWLILFFLTFIPAGVNELIILIMAVKKKLHRKKFLIIVNSFYCLFYVYVLFQFIMYFAPMF